MNNNEVNGVDDFDVYIVKTDADGDTTWTRTFGTLETEYANYARQTSDGGYIICGAQEVCPGLGCSSNIYLIKTNAAGQVTSIRDHRNQNPLAYHLEQNYPNPFNPSTTIHYQLAEPQMVQLIIYNINGRIIRQLVNSRQVAGEYSIKWDGKNASNINVAAGIYFYKIIAGDFLAVKKMLLVR